ncbi:MAG: FAD-binding protein [Chloroflexi bacterium]|nr:FAD-binding protein [Chloroflexota bacterium]
MWGDTVADAASPVNEALKAVLPPELVISDRDRLTRYRGVAWGIATSKLSLVRPPAPPLAVVRPQTTDHVVAVLRVARETATPVVPHGAGTGVHAGAAPVEGSILLDLGAMRRIISISREDRLARVEPGVLLGDLDREAQAAGLMVGHDPWSQPIASVGGAVSTNGVGYLAGKYGAMGNQVLGLEVVLASGQVLRMSAVPKSSTGPALRDLFIGAEGVLGIITEVAMRLFPVPERRALAGYRFPRFEAGLDAILEMESIQLRPSMIDYEEDDASTGQLRLGLLVDLTSEMYLAFEGFREEVEAQVHRADEICRRHAGEAMDCAEVDEFWETRHESAERYVRQLELDPEGLARLDRTRRWTSTYLNVGLRPQAIQAFRQRAARELAPYRLAVKSSGVWGMPELFSARFEHQAPDDPQAPADLDAGTDLGLRIVQDLGGSMEYCHGVGLSLAHLMESELGPGLEVLRRVKRALDPDGLLNPGKLAL